MFCPICGKPLKGKTVKDTAGDKDEIRRLIFR